MLTALDMTPRASFATTYAIRRTAELLARTDSKAEQAFYTHMLRSRLDHCPETERGGLAQLALETVRSARNVR